MLILPVNLKSTSKSIMAKIRRESKSFVSLFTFPQRTVTGISQRFLFPMMQPLDIQFHIPIKQLLLTELR